MVTALRVGESAIFFFAKNRSDKVSAFLQLAFLAIDFGIKFMPKAVLSKNWIDLAKNEDDESVLNKNYIFRVVNVVNGVLNGVVPLLFKNRVSTGFKYVLGSARILSTFISLYSIFGMVRAKREGEDLGLNRLSYSADVKLESRQYELGMWQVVALNIASFLISSPVLSLSKMLI
ncbi:MAG: hypothetical protein P0S95_05010 [Rhabdochlamydiaceae bacterium]|nr:hypothetical protein [Candidatus Amphrikana amoebophyrae]